MSINIIIYSRAPEMTQRPSFQDIIRQLSLPDTKLLKLSEEDKSVHPEAATLGAGLLCGEGLYKDLQARYQGETQLVLYILKSPNENKNMSCVCVGILATCTTHFHLVRVRTMDEVRPGETKEVFYFLSLTQDSSIQKRFTVNRRISINSTASTL